MLVGAGIGNIADRLTVLRLRVCKPMPLGAERSNAGFSDNIDSTTYPIISPPLSKTAIPLAATWAPLRME